MAVCVEMLQLDRSVWIGAYIEIGSETRTVIVRDLSLNPGIHVERAQTSEKTAEYNSTLLYIYRYYSTTMCHY